MFVASCVVVPGSHGPNCLGGTGVAVGVGRCLDFRKLRLQIDCDRRECRTVRQVVQLTLDLFNLDFHIRELLMDTQYLIDGFCLVKETLDPVARRLQVDQLRLEVQLLFGHIVSAGSVLQDAHREPA